MIVKEPKYRKQLNDNQKQLLGLLFKFRFGTTDLIAELTNKNRSTIYERLHVLEKQGYVSKFYDKDYRLQGKPAIYTLNTKGITYLKNNTNYSQTTLRGFYKNRTAKPEIIDKCLIIFKIAVELKKRYGRTHNIYTKYLFNKDYFVDPLPDLYLKGKEDNPDYLVDYVESYTLSWLLRRRINQHKDFVSNEDEEDDKHPHVMFITGNESTERRLFKYTYENYGDFEFYITQYDLLISDEPDIWIDPDEAEEDDMVRLSLFTSDI